MTRLPVHLCHPVCDFGSHVTQSGIVWRASRHTMSDMFIGNADCQGLFSPRILNKARGYGVATINRLLKIWGLFLQKSPIKEAIFIGNADCQRLSSPRIINKAYGYVIRYECETHMWSLMSLRLISYSCELQVSFAKEPYERGYIHRKHRLSKTLFA